MMPSEPNVTRVLLRIELANGEWREFEAREPYDVDFAVTLPDPVRFGPELHLPASLMTAGEAVGVRFDLKANRRYGCEIAVRTPDDNDESCVTCGASSALWQPQHREAI